VLPGSSNSSQPLYRVQDAHTEPAIREDVLKYFR
jgi:hypothetical protein